MSITLVGFGTSAGTLAMWQTTEAVSSNPGDTHRIMIWVAIAAVALLVEAVLIVGAIVGAGIFALKIKKDVTAEINQLKVKIMPLIDKSHGLVGQVQHLTTELTPTIKNITEKASVITGHVEHIAGVAREKVDEFAPTITAANKTVTEANDTVREANQKTQEQVARVNGMVTSVLDATAQMGKSLRHGITQPGREVAGLVSGVKATFGALLHRPAGSGGKRPFGSTVNGTPYRSVVTPYRSMSDVPDEGTATEGYRASDLK